METLEESLTRLQAEIAELRCERAELARYVDDLDRMPRDQTTIDGVIDFIRAHLGIEVSS